MFLALVTCLCACVAAEDRTGWIARPLTDALWGFAPNSTSNPLCQQQSILYTENLKKGTLWAVQMFESSALAPHGILSGNTYQLGQFDECVTLSVPQHNIRGKYCLPRIHFAPSQQFHPEFFQDKYNYNPFSLYYPPEVPVWDKIKVTPDPSKINRDEIQWALCVPSACSTQDILFSLNFTLSTTFNDYNINGSVILENDMCHTEEPYTQGFKVLSAIFGVLVIFVLLATFYDLVIYRHSEISKLSQGKGIRLVLAFSIYRNLLNLKKPDSSSELAVMHGMRTYSMCLIILGHRCMFSYGGAIHNFEFIEDRYRDIKDSFLLNGTVIVDTFFILSGFLTCYMTYIELEKRRKLQILKMYLYRWLRITPTYMVMVAFYAFILPQIGDGPLWQSKAGLEAQRCQENWWTNLLFINNYVNPDRLCMLQSWFITCDMHYFLVAPFIVQLLWKHPTVGKTFLFILFCLATLTPSVITYYKGYNGVLMVYKSILEDPTKNEQYYNFYIKSHNRAIPYIMGMAAAYSYFHLKAAKLRIHRSHITYGGIVGTALGLSAVMVAFAFYIPGVSINPIFHALYASLHRVIWAIPMCWLIIVGGLKGYGVLDRILSLRALVPLSRLTYCAFLVHAFIQLYSVATLRNPQYMSFPILFWMTFGDITLSFITALILHLLIEAPISVIQKILLRPNRNVHKPKDVKPELNATFVIESQPQNSTVPVNTNSTESSPDKMPSINTYIEHERL